MYFSVAIEKNATDHLKHKQTYKSHATGGHFGPGL